MAVTSTTIGVSVHQHDDNAVYGETATHVTLDDDSGGAYVVLRQSNEDAKVGEVRLSMEELKRCCDVASFMFQNLQNYQQYQEEEEK